MKTIKCFFFGCDQKPDHTRKYDDLIVETVTSKDNVISIAVTAVTRIVASTYCPRCSTKRDAPELRYTQRVTVDFNLPYIAGLISDGSVHNVDMFLYQLFFCQADPKWESELSPTIISATEFDSWTKIQRSLGRDFRASYGKFDLYNGDVLSIRDLMVLTLDNIKVFDDIVKNYNATI